VIYRRNTGHIGNGFGKRNGMRLTGVVTGNLRSKNSIVYHRVKVSHRMLGVLNFQTTYRAFLLYVSVLVWPHV